MSVTIEVKSLEFFEQNLADCTFIVFDIETTGGNPTRNGITEICALRVEQGEVKDRFYSLVNPKIPIPPIVRKMTGINNRMLKNEPVIDAVMPGFVEFIGDGILVSHNTIGDLKFLVHFAKSVCKIDLKCFFLCTHLLTEKLLSKAPDKSLKGLEAFLKLSPNGGDAHRAEADALVTLELFKVLKDKLEETKINKLGDAIRFQGDFNSGLRLGLVLPFEELAKNLPSKPGLIKLKDRNKKLLFVSSLTNLKREVLSFSRLGAMPRKMVKILLQSYYMETEEHLNLFSAMLSESKWLAVEDVSYLSYKWHQRFVSSIFFSNVGRNMQLSVGCSDSGAFASFGPIHDKKKAELILEQLAVFFDAKASKRKLTLPIWGQDLLKNFFIQRSSLSWIRLIKALFLSPVLFDAIKRRELFNKFKILYGLRKLDFPEPLQSLFDLSGCLIIPCLDRTWSCYLIDQTKIVAEKHKFKSLRSIDVKSLTSKLTAVKSERVDRAIKSFSVEESFHMHAVAWTILNAKNKRSDRRQPIFIATEDIPKELDALLSQNQK